MKDRDLIKLLKKMTGNLTESPEATIFSEKRVWPFQFPCMEKMFLPVCYIKF